VPTCLPVRGRAPWAKVKAWERRVPALYAPASVVGTGPCGDRMWWHSGGVASYTSNAGPDETGQRGAVLLIASDVLPSAQRAS
jgi:hypothetical protein